MKIGIITFVKCNNYGAELQAFALQHKLNTLGYDAEVIDMEKEKGTLESSFSTYRNAIKNRYKQFGLFRGTRSVLRLVVDKYKVKNAYKNNKDVVKRKNDIFNSFFYSKIRHSDKYYTLEELRNALTMPYDILVAGSDQIWNYMQTRYLDVFFLMMANNWGAKKISYAGSFSVEQIPESMRDVYKRFLENMDAISVREINGLDIVKSCTNHPASLVLDPTLLLDRKEWVDNLAKENYLPPSKSYVVIYTLSGSHYIYSLAKKIASYLGVEVINIKSNLSKVKGDDGINHILDAGPQEFISIYNQAAYVITDSFHGTAFSLNFNIPFTTLLNPVSSMNSRALSILKLTKTEDRLIYDDGANREPQYLDMDFSGVNEILREWRKKSMDFIQSSLTV